MRSLNYRARFIELAADINAEMPVFVAGKVRQALNGARRSVNGSRVLVLGVAYKKDVSDVRESPALDVMRLLEAEGAEVSYHDPFVPQLEEDGESRSSVELTDEALKRADVVVLLTDHSTFDYARLYQRSRALVDARNATAHLVNGDRERGKAWIVKGGEPQ
jgi:UDP-N-acetyl-D-glucosamine dehydrogenase